MLIERPNHKELTPNELQKLEQLRNMIDQAIADGKISKYEMERIEHTIHDDGKVSIEEMTLMRQLIRDKVDHGFLSYDYS